MDDKTRTFTPAGLMDFRAFVNELERIGELVKIDEEIDRDEEAGAIMCYGNEKELKGQWFTNIKGAMRGSSLLGGIYSTRARMAVAFGLPADASFSEITDLYAENVTKRIKPVIVESGSCQENVVLGDDIDLFKLPIVQLHPQDGAPYIGTLNVGVCKDLDSDWVNWGMYRGMVQSKNSTGLWLGPLNQGGQILKKYTDNNQVMEYAMFFGGDPMHNIIASSGIPPGVSEVEVVGGMRGAPVKLVKCKTVDLYVPENAEIVLEGRVTPGDLHPEGPFGEYPGYVTPGTNDRPVFRLTALTYRNDPLFPATCMGIGADEGSMLWSVEVAASVKEALRIKGVPVVDVAVPEISSCHAVVVSTKTPTFGLPQLISNVVWTDRNGRYFPYVIVVDEDINVWNFNEVFHAICTKCNPAKDIHIWRGAPAPILTPYASGHPLAELAGGETGNVLFDATFPVNWGPEKRPHRMAFDTSYSEGTKKKVRDNIGRWGL